MLSTHNSGVEFTATPVLQVPRRLRKLEQLDISHGRGLTASINEIVGGYGV